MKNTIKSIQVLRGFAATLVVMFHVRNELAKDLPNVAHLFLHGSIGVDLFFMISGFIAYYVTYEENSGLHASKTFIIKRLCRILPPYIIATLFVAGSSLHALIETIRSLLFLPRDTSHAAPWFGYAKLDVGWTLNYEFSFYILCSISMLFKKYKFIALIIMIASSVLIPFYINPHQYSSLVNINYGYSGYLAIITNGMMLEFLAGMFIAHLLINVKIRFRANIWILSCILSVMFFLYTMQSGSYAGNGHVGYVLASFLLLFSIVGYDINFGITPPKALINLGSSSFSIYLMHRRGFSIASKICHKIPVKSYSGVIFTVTSIIFTGIFSYLSHKYIEGVLCKKILNKLQTKNIM